VLSSSLILLIGSGFFGFWVLVSSCEDGSEDGNEDGCEARNEAGFGCASSLLSPVPFFGSRFAPGIGGPWFSEPEVRAEDLPHALPVQAVPDGDLFERQSLHGTQPEHVVLARLWRMGAVWLDRDVQAERLHDQQSDLQGDRAVARFEARKDGRLALRHVGTAREGASPSEQVGGQRAGKGIGESEVLDDFAPSRRRD
jgi:hypothetical protein